MGTYSYMLTMVVIVCVDLSLKLVAAEEMLSCNYDLDWEFRTAGVTNCVFGLMLLPPAYFALKFTSLNHSVVGNADSRLPIGIATAFMCLQFATGFPLVNYIPRFLGAGLFIYSALAFLVENLVESYWSFTFPGAHFSPVYNAVLTVFLRLHFTRHFIRQF